MSVGGVLEGEYEWNIVAQVIAASSVQMTKYIKCMKHPYSPFV